MLRAAVLACILSIYVAAYAADPMLGRWSILSTGTEIEIIPGDGGAGYYDVKLHDCADYRLPIGITIGNIRPSATPGRFVASIAEKPGAHRKRMRDLVVSLRPDGTLSFEPYHKGRRISLWRWIPYMFRVTVLMPGEQPSDTEGAVRLDNNINRYREL